MTAADLIARLADFAATLAGLVFLWWRGKALLLYFQQEEYDAPRFRRWFRQNHAYDRRASLIALAGIALILVARMAKITLPAAAPSLLMALAALEGARLSRRLVLGAKKPLVMTARAKRLFRLTLLIGVLTLLFSAVVFEARSPEAAPLLVLLVIAQGIPWMLLIAHGLLLPHERRVNARFRAEAVETLARLDPFVIGITGSFGKTSTKSLLAHILGSVAPTLATPGSVNTEMGITRIVRETLRPEHRWFVVEMGAYGPGSIARLCRLAPPKLAIVTAVGDAHYERFKSLETVYAAKFEIVDSTLSQGGEAIVVADAIPKEMLAHRLREPGSERILPVGSMDDPGLFLRLVSVLEERDGLRIVIRSRTFGEATLKVPVFGRHQAENILAATAAALRLGIPIETIRAALASAPQTRHRLEVIRKGGITIIDDAYNSNPRGFASALALLDLQVAPGGRRILITPGMVELGARHEAEHGRLGALAARHVDIALIVTPARIVRFVAAYRAERPEPGALMTFERQAEAEAWIAAHARPGDAILYENNLPDLYERRPRF
ncbi:MAG: UDP-N-acetylmuramoyl-tripeptide--D-alanyl-D-alanine ligase [Rhodothalassiaceae bacterium]